MLRRLVVLVALAAASAGVALSAPACGEACDTAATGSCCCFELIEQEQMFGAVQNNCAAATSCGALTGRCPDNNPHERCEPDDVAALDCVLAALQADASGRVEWSTQPYPPASDPDSFGLDVRTVTVYTAGDGVAIRTGSRNTGLTFNNEPVTRHALADLDLAACAAVPEPGPRFDCLRQAVADAPALEVCIDPRP